MQYDVNSPDDYLKSLESDWRKEILNQVRSFIINYDNSLIESIEYKMLSYGIGNKNIFHLNAQRNYVSLYVGDINKIPNANKLLEVFDKGKGCIRIKKTTDINDGKLETFIRNVIDMCKSGGNTNC